MILMHLDPIAQEIQTASCGNGDAMVVKEADVSKRPADMMYFRFNCTMNGKFTDGEVCQDDHTIQFSLRLPKTVKGQKPAATSDAGMDDTCRRLFGPKQNADGATAPTRTTEASKDKDEDEDVVVSEKDKGLSTPNNKTGFDAATSPKMDRLLGSNGSGAGQTLLSYYGELDFLDSQSSIPEGFWEEPRTTLCDTTTSSQCGRERQYYGIRQLVR